MARIKGGVNAKKKHNRVLKLAKGYRGARSKQYRVAKQSVMRALASSYAGRKEKKRQFRQLWIARINAAARMNGLSYSKFMCFLLKEETELLILSLPHFRIIRIYICFFYCNEKQISDYLKKFAGERGLECIQDALNNIIIIKEATPGYEQEAPYILHCLPCSMDRSMPCAPVRPVSSSVVTTISRRGCLISCASSSARM